MKQPSYNHQSEQFAAILAEAGAEAQSILKERNAGKRAKAEAEAQSILKERNSNLRTETDFLKKKWKRMFADAFKVSLEIQKPDDAIRALNMIIPPALADIPMAIVYTAVIFKNIGQEEEAVKWADKIMTLDPQNENDDVMLAKGRIFEKGIGRYAANAEKAISFYKSAAAKGNQDALCFIADMYYEGEMMKQDYQMVLSIAKMAYEAKNAYGLFIYGRAYCEGKGQPKDSLIGKRLIYDAIGMRNTSYIGATMAEIYKKKKNL